MECSHDALDIGAFENHNEYYESKIAAKTFWSVARAYSEALEAHPVVALNYNDEEPPNRRLGPALIEFKVDCERIAKKALGNDQGLYANWLKLIDGQDVPNANHIIRRVGNAFMKAQLVPWLYFRKIRLGRKRGAA
jgi:hypothetical protein